MNKIEWLVIGARRWGRVIANELCKVLDSKESVMILGDPEDRELLDWWEKNPHKDQLRIVQKIKTCCQKNTGVAIIANSAYLHKTSTEEALNSGYNVVSEKPLTFSLIESISLLEKAKNLDLDLFSTNTYIFSDYLKIFRDNWILDQKISHIDIKWCDPAGESRYGETKSYDSSTPIIYDVLPHIAAIVLASYGEVEIISSTIKVSKGGSEVRLKIRSKGFFITVLITRNSPQRQRSLHFSGTNLDVTLDFTEESGLVTSFKKPPLVSDIKWDCKRRPISEMLYSIKNYFEGGVTDNRFSAHSALLGNELIDSVAKEYVEQQIAFLNLEEHSGVSQDLYFSYAQKEVASLKKRALDYLSNESPLKKLALK